MVDAHNNEAQTHIERLRKETVVALEQVKLLHQWLDRKRSSRQCEILELARLKLAKLTSSVADSLISLAKRP